MRNIPEKSPTPLDGGLPVLKPLCTEQAAIAEAYAYLLTELASKLGSADESQAVGLRILLERLRYDAPWAVSEVRKPTSTKLRRQRFISQDVFDRWRQVQAQPKHRLGDFDKDASGRTLIHEHVVQRKGLGIALKTLADASQIATLLATVTACVVSKDEDNRLSAVKDFDGWERYRQANIGVYDRQERCWHLPRTPE